MCGIAGIVDSKGVNPSQLRDWSRLLRHRGPDDEGFVLKERGQPAKLRCGDDTISDLKDSPHITSASWNSIAALLHRRLSIIDLSPMGHQPMNRGDCWLVFNGEIYNYIEVREVLTSYGYEFMSDSDTEVLLVAYLHWGQNCVEHLVGMWAFSILDERNSRLFLSRDRFGIKPLYYRTGNARFEFASELKPWLRSGECNEVRIEEALMYCVYGWHGERGRTLLRDVNELPPGYNIVVDLSTAEATTSQYYCISERVRSVADLASDDVVPRYRELFDLSLDQHLRADVSIGTCLSGGLDSTAIAACAAQKLVYPTKTFTAGYDDSACDERTYVKLLSERYSRLEASYTYPDICSIWDEIDTYLYYQDLPVQSTSPLAQWEVMKLANSEGVKVLLDGQGADEVIGGYSYFAGAMLWPYLKSFNLTKLYTQSKLLRERRSVNATKEVFRVLFSRLPRSVQRAVWSRQRSGGAFLAKSYFRLVSDLHPPVRSSTDYREACILAIQHNLPTLLRYEDRSSMAFSIEARLPFLDHRFVEGVLCLPTEEKFSEGWSKYVQRRAFESDLPAEIVWRRDKMGYKTPQRLWLDNLQRVIAEMLEEIDLPIFIDASKLRTRDGKEHYCATALTEYWRLLLFAKWADLNAVVYV